jgi:hypothetical protein
MATRPGRIAAAAVIFSVTGLVSATWAARIPATQERLHLSPGALGLAVLCIEGGALLGLPAGAILVTRRGSRPSLRLGFAIYPGLLWPLAVAPSFGWLAALLVVWAAANSVIDVAMNAAGVELEERAGRPLLSRLHASQSGGLVAGALLATAAAAAGLPLPAHFGTVAAAGAVCGLAATACLPAGPGGAGVRLAARPGRRLMLPGIVAFCAFLIDGAASNWAAVGMRTEQHATATLAAATYTAFTAAVALVRLGGDRAIARFPRARIVQVSGITAAGGAILVVLAPAAAAALAGWTIIGAGLALLAPAILGAAPQVAAGIAPGAAIAAVTTAGYLGSFTGPPLIGALAGLLTLSGAIGLVAVAAATAVLLAPAALPSSSPRRAPRSP